MEKELKCKWCGKICKSLNSLHNHEIRCKQNPNSIMHIEGYKGGGGWNKGLTKETNESVKKGSESLKQTYRNGYVCAAKGKPSTFKGKHHTEEAKEKMRQSAIDRELGGWNRRNQIDYRGIKLGSSYEVTLAKDLDKNNISWEKPSYFIYKDLNQKEHRYYPDFYLPEYNIYLDPKNSYLLNNINKNFGYSDKDKITWVCEQNNVKVLILDKDHLSWEAIWELLNN